MPRPSKPKAYSLFQRIRQGKRIRYQRFGHCGLPLESAQRLKAWAVQHTDPSFVLRAIGPFNPERVS